MGFAFEITENERHSIAPGALHLLVEQLSPFARVHPKVPASANLSRVLTDKRPTVTYRPVKRVLRVHEGSVDTGLSTQKWPRGG